jgi:type II secretory pathway pseudopilin PulG
MTPLPSNKSAFSLVEVVVAVGIFALAIVAVFGLLTPIARDSAAVIENSTAVSLAENINRELERVGGAVVGGLATATPDTVYLVATADGSRVLRSGDSAIGASGSHPAENALDHATVAGIAQRDRFYLIEVKLMVDDGSDGNDRINSTTFGPNAGAIPVRVRVSWPLYQPRSGPPTGSPSGSWDNSSVDPDGTTVAGNLVPAANRSVYFFSSAVRR